MYFAVIAVIVIIRLHPFGPFTSLYLLTHFHTFAPPRFCLARYELVTLQCEVRVFAAILFANVMLNASEASPLTGAQKRYSSLSLRMTEKNGQAINS